MAASTWILTGSPENYAATRDLGFSVIGLKERRRKQALEIEPGDRIVFYITRLMAFAASATIAGELFEARERLWPGKPGAPDQYPWRFPLTPEFVLAEDEWIPAETLIDRLEHIKRWPPAHWKLAFQGQIRLVSQHDARLLTRLLRSRAAVAA